MLTLRDATFTTGAAYYQDEDINSRSSQAAIFVQINLEIGNGVSLYAMLDTGAPYCILDREVTEAAGLSFEEGEELTISTRAGAISGRLQRFSITLEAIQGNSLVVDSTIFVSEHWTLGTFLGYSGFLERIRFALDPDENIFYFGPLGRDQH